MKIFSLSLHLFTSLVPNLFYKQKKVENMKRERIYFLAFSEIINKKLWTLKTSSANIGFSDKNLQYKRVRRRERERERERARMSKSNKHTCTFELNPLSLPTEPREEKKRKKNCPKCFQLDKSLTENWNLWRDERRKK